MAKNAATGSGTGNQIVGKVLILYGTVKAISPDGAVRVLAPNSPIFADDRIITESDGSVSIMLDGSPPSQLDLGRMTEMIIDHDVYAGAAPEAVTDATAEAKQIQEALLQGDKPIELEATAAGGGTGAGGGHPTVVFTATGEEVTPGSGAETTGITTTTVDPITGELAGPGTLTASPDFASIQEGYGEGHVIGGNVLTNDISSDGTITVTAINGSTTNVDVPLATSAGGTITIHADGSYSYIPPEHVDHSQGEVHDIITYTITNAEGNSASTTLDINILDTVPTGGETAATVDDDGLQGGNVGGIGDITLPDIDSNEATFSGTLQHHISADGYGSVTFADMDGHTGTVGTETVTYSWSEDTLTATVTGGDRDGTDLFTVQVTSDTGDYTVTLLDNVLHETGGDENDASTSLTYTIIDSDGSPATGTLNVTFDDDTPVLLGESETTVESPAGQEISTHIYEGIPGPGEGGNALVNGLGGPHGFGENYLAPNDDSYTGKIDVSSIFPEGMNLFGHTYDGFYINNNGNITFEYAMGTYTPFAITGTTSNPMIAPFFADVDTRGGGVTPSAGGTSTGSNLVWYDFDQANGVITITWDDVGYYGSHTDHTNAFQLRIFDQGDKNFSFEFRYENVDWTTGDASGGSGGLGGVIARAGWTAGDGVNYYELPQAGDQTGMLGLETTSNPSTSPDGSWVFNVIGGEIVIGGSSDTITVEEESIPGIHGNDEADGLSFTAHGTIVDNVSWGADGFGHVVSVTAASGSPDTAETESAITLSTSAWELVVDKGTGNYTFTMLDNLQHDPEQGENPLTLPSFSITGVDGDGDPISVALNVIVQDDIPVLSVASDALTVDEDGLTGHAVDGDPLHAGEATGTGLASATGNLADNFNFGADGADATAAIYSVNGHTATEGHIVISETGYTLDVTAATGAYTFTLTDNMIHDPVQGENLQALLENGIALTVVAQDADGDQVSGAVTLNVDVQDDIPVLSVASDALTVDEDGLTGHAVDGDPLHTGEATGTGLASATGNLADNFNFGADGADATAAIYSVNGHTATEGHIVISETGYTLDVTAATGAYTFTLTDNMIHDPVQGENLQALLENGIALTVVAQDADGDQVSGAVTLNVDVLDDMPIAYDSDGTALHSQITIDTGNTNLTTGMGADDMVHITVTAPGDSSPYLINNGQAFGIDSSVDGNQSYSHEINYLGDGKSEVMSFELQNGSDEAAEGKIATHATVDINLFYKGEDMNGPGHFGVANEVGSYELYNNGNLVQGPTTFTANSTGGHFQLDISPTGGGGFDEIRFSALQGSPAGNDPDGGDSSDYNVKSITFDLMPVKEGNLLTGSDPDGSFGADGGHVDSIAGVGGGTTDSDHSDGLTVTGQYGGTLVVDPSDGDYIYTPPASGGGQGHVTETFDFTIIDGDGDTASAQLSMLIDDPTNQSN